MAGVFRLRGQGMPRLGKSPTKGDLHAEVHAELPTHLSERERELLEEFAARRGGRRGGSAMSDRTTRLPGDRPLEAVAEQVHVAPARIRYYVRIGLLTPSRVEGRRVYFGESELARLRKIRRLHDDLGLDRGRGRGRTPPSR